MNSKIKELFIKDFFTELGKNNNYCILRNYEQLPSFVGDDIDILVETSDEKLINNIVEPISKQLGWQYIVKMKKKGFTPIVFLKREVNMVETLQIDFYTQFLWRNCNFLDERAILKNSEEYGIFKVASHGADIAVIIAKELFGSGFIRDKYREKLLIYPKEDKKVFFQVLSPIFGKSYVYKLYQLSTQGRYEELNQEANNIKHIIIKKHIGKYLITSIKNIKEHIVNYMAPRGKMIAFVGPDGSGKTTLIGNEEKYLERFFPHNVYIFHRRYEIFPELHTGHGFSSMKGKITAGKSGISEDGKKANRQKRSLISKLAAWFVVLYYTSEYVVGNFRARRIIKKNGLILYDRYYYDHFIQPATRDLIWESRRLLLALVKKPDIIIHLIASGDVIYKRKQDLKADEIDIQNQYMNRILKCCENVYDVYTDNLTADEVASEVFSIVIKHFFGEEIACTDTKK